MNQPTITRSWVASANDHADFPLQNLPLGVFSLQDSAPRSGVAIGEHIFDLEAALDAGLFEGAAKAAVEATRGGQLNAFFELGRPARVALRERLLELLGEGSSLRGKVEAQGAKLLPLAADCQMHLPAKITDYTDFYVGIEHAQNVGKLFRPDNPLLPNYKYVPIGYHGRASTIRTSGADVRRPKGQTLPAGQSEPTFGPCARLDYELELGIWIGQGNEMGEPIAIGDAAEHIAGFCLLNDWSARDIQAWEYQPLGPFLSKSFITSISPWVVTAEALEPFRRAQTPRPEGDPQPLSYLLDKRDQAAGGFDIELEVLLLTEKMREQGLPAHRLTLSNTQYMYWTVAQMVAHHSVNGCQLQAGDLFGSGTLSGPQSSQFGSLLEITEGGKKPIELASGEVRKFLEDGDEIILRGRCRREGFASIGFGECRGKILPAR
ncbi:fumarylacetoacetase [Pseudomonas chlororaphis]|uniref:fumarylacetoacetase n=1 Tax=Pseudomonas chlororaphis TaxID=587753 RepID=A0AAX3FZS9_9PSED|nr:fumarylacetoacetase [Pseudomonas chlororaphis]AZC35395.1 Fumarylacetoacetase [Pseudomonas chlororaphis subsp. piscium]AZC41936.1 Fumarylacetoacetase [Pseudomonas chlororaphis subsp. piscium]WDG73890.1 fumarylacetoacetase [Pseudomonas chlororaphis]WDH28473.1 fumarylacetoacetase [Pseudomonas chlororaphis]WDH72411.1 fumarylacetoacetase [Pseudomonas chlororaphis]